jgi:LIVCS family branched-chain amino acid:cation transporter
LFFGAAWAGAMKPGRLLKIVGKYLNPLFLVLLAILFGFSFLAPMGRIDGIPAVDAYSVHPVTQGMTDGYNTLDLLASLAFGIVVIATLKDLGLKKKGEIAVATVKAGVIVVLLMAVIYTCLSFTGLLSLGHFARSSNGGVALAQIARWYLGSGGLVLIALIVTVACLKTAIGLVSAASSAAIDLFPRLKYSTATIVFSAASALFANTGLDAIIQASLPVLMFLYPLAIVLVLLAFLDAVFPLSRCVYVWVTAATACAAFFDALHAAPTAVQTFPPIADALTAASQLPLFSHGLGWLTPALAGLVCGLVQHFACKPRRS